MFISCIVPCMLKPYEWDVYLDGKRLAMCKEADSDEGWAVVALEAEQVSQEKVYGFRDPYPRCCFGKVVRGKIEIRKIDNHTPSTPDAP